MTSMPGDVDPGRDGPGVPDVSIIVAAHNAGRTIDEALESALAQQDASIEVIVVDDGSTDDTAERIRAHASRDDRIVTLSNPRPTGAAAARNTGLSAATGTWVTTLDADDLMAPTRCATLLALAAGTGASIVADNIARFDDGVPTDPARGIDGMRGARPLLDPSRTPQVVDVATFLDRNHMLGGEANLGYLKPMLRRSIVTTAHLSYQPSLRIGEDFDLLLRALLAASPIVVCAQPLYFYRLQSGTLSTTLDPADIDALIDALDALAAAPALQPQRARVAAAAYRASLERARAWLAWRRGLRGWDVAAILAGLIDPGVWQAGTSLVSRALARRWARSSRTTPAHQPVTP